MTMSMHLYKEKYFFNTFLFAGKQLKKIYSKLNLEEDWQIHAKSPWKIIIPIKSEININ